AAKSVRSPRTRGGSSRSSAPMTMGGTLPRAGRLRVDFAGLMPDSPDARMAPGILYYDPNPTTAKLATASLRLAGYEVFNAASQRDAVSMFKQHGAGGDKSIVALLLDASADPTVSAAVLRELVRLPGASELPGVLIVSRRNPNPIPAAAGRVRAARRPDRDPPQPQPDPGGRRAAHRSPAVLEPGAAQGRQPDDRVGRRREAAGRHGRGAGSAQGPARAADQQALPQARR